MVILLTSVSAGETHFVGHGG